MRGKGEFSKSILIEPANTYNSLPRAAVSNGLIIC